MINALLDTNILVDYLLGIDAAKRELGRYHKPAISVITWMEVLVGAPPAAEAHTREILAQLALLPLDAAVAERAVVIRRTRKIKLPDAIVWATAQVHSMLLVTRNTRDFPAKEPGVRVPYG